MDSTALPKALLGWMLAHLAEAAVANVHDQGGVQQLRAECQHGVMRVLLCMPHRQQAGAALPARSSLSQGCTPHMITTCRSGMHAYCCLQQHVHIGSAVAVSGASGLPTHAYSALVP